MSPCLCLERAANLPVAMLFQPRRDTAMAIPLLGRARIKVILYQLSITAVLGLNEVLRLIEFWRRGYEFRSLRYGSESRQLSPLSKQFWRHPSTFGTVHLTARIFSSFFQHCSSFIPLLSLQVIYPNRNLLPIASYPGKLQTPQQSHERQQISVVSTGIYPTVQVGSCRENDS